ncbi:MAG: hypothetical protein J6P65_07400 [Bacteroidales bacterium]|nr:hypothetical protein [Bacteroidales bacterium]
MKRSCLLHSPRRGATHAVQLTPYKPLGAVWWMKVLAPYKYLGEMRQTVQGSDDKSHISDMHDVYCPIVTTLYV